MPSTGTTISHYRILERLGSGGMGTVYRAEDTALKRTVGLKFLSPDLMRDPAARSRFIHEARAASALDHPNICTIHEIAETGDGQLFIVMTCYEGETLKQRLGHGSLTCGEALDIGRQMASGVAAAHRLGITHRDLKPANVFLTHEGVVKILDFGLAKLTGQTEVTAPDSAVGTVAYMAPEQITGGIVDARSDIWAFGAILVEMLTGSLPFRGDHPAARMYAIVNESPTLVPDSRNDVPSAVRDLCARCLRKDPAERPASMDEVRTILEAAKGIGAAARRIPSRWIAVGAAAVLVVVSFLLINPPRFHPTAEPGTRVTLAVFPFRISAPNEVTAAWPAMIQQLMFGTLTGSRELAVVDPSSLNGYMESSFGGPQPRSAEDLRRLTGNVRVTFAIDGSIVANQGRYLLRENVLEPGTSEVKFTSSVTVAGEQDLLGAVDSLSRQLMDFLRVEVLMPGQGEDLRPWYSFRSHTTAAVRAFVQASEYMMRGDPGGEKYLRRAIELDSAFVSPRIWLISGLAWRGKNEEARRQYEMLLGLEPAATPFEQAMINWAGAYLAHDVAGEVRSLEVALDYSPRNNILLFEIARAKYILEDFAGAVHALEPAIEMEWRYPPSYYLLGACYASQKEFREAKSILERGLTVEPVFAGTYGLLAAVAMRDGDTVLAASAEDRYVRALLASGVPDDSVSETLANFYRSTGAVRDAVRCLRSAVSVKPASAAYRMELAEALQDAGDGSGACEQFLKVLSLDSTRFDVHARLGEILESNGDTLQALGHYEAYLHHVPAGAETMQIKERVARLRPR